MIRPLCTLLVACTLAGCYRPWAVVREGTGTAAGGGATLKVTLVDRFTAAALVDKGVEKRREGREARNHPYLSLFRVELTLPASPGVLYLLSPAGLSLALDGVRSAILTPAEISREFRDALYLTADWLRLLRADISGGGHPARSVPFPPELTLLPGERVVFHLLVPRIPYRAREASFSLRVRPFGISPSAGVPEGGILLQARFPLGLRKIQP